VSMFSIATHVINDLYVANQTNAKNTHRPACHSISKKGNR